MTELGREASSAPGIKRQIFTTSSQVRFARLVDANHRTAVRHLTKFTQLGIVEQVRTFGGFHYKLRQAVASDEGRRHVEELEAVRQIFAEDKCDG